MEHHSVRLCVSSKPVSASLLRASAQLGKMEALIRALRDNSGEKNVGAPVEPTRFAPWEPNGTDKKRNTVVMAAGVRKPRTVRQLLGAVAAERVAAAKGKRRQLEEAKAATMTMRTSSKQET